MLSPVVVSFWLLQDFFKFYKKARSFLSIFISYQFVKIELRFIESLCSFFVEHVHLLKISHSAIVCVRSVQTFVFSHVQLRFYCSAFHKHFFFDVVQLIKLKNLRLRLRILALSYSVISLHFQRAICTTPFPFTLKRFLIVVLRNFLSTDLLFE